MLLSLSTACLYYFPLRTTFRLAAEAGFDGMELVMSPQVWLRGARYVASLAREYGLGIYSVHQTLMRAAPSGRGPHRIIDAANVALELGCPCVVIHAACEFYWAAPKVQHWLRMVEFCQERLLGSGTRLAVENMGIGADIDIHSILAHLPVLFSFARRHDLDITFDTCHAGTDNMELVSAYELIRERLVNVHLSDLAPGRGERNRFLRLLHAHHQMPGEGRLPLRGFLSRLATDGFEGPISMEIGPVALRVWSPRQLRQRLAQAVEYARSAIREADI